MISYNKIDNSIQAYFGRWADNDDAFYYWYHELSKYFTKHCKNVSAYLVSSIVNDMLCECKVSGMKFYGEAKCSPDDIFEEEIGKQIAKTRLINKYNRVVAGINRELIKLVKSDLSFLKGE